MNYVMQLNLNVKLFFNVSSTNSHQLGEPPGGALKAFRTSSAV